MDALDRISVNPAVMGGKACVRGMRVTVGRIGAGRTLEDLLGDYPYLEREELMQAPRYAAWRAAATRITRPS